MHRIWAIIERELRRFRRSPALIIMSLIMPIAQLVVLGYAFGGQVKNLKVALVDQDHGLPAVRLHALSNAVGENDIHLLIGMILLCAPRTVRRDKRDGRARRRLGRGLPPLAVPRHVPRLISSSSIEADAPASAW